MAQKKRQKSPRNQMKEPYLGLGLTGTTWEKALRSPIPAKGKIQKRPYEVTRRSTQANDTTSGGRSHGCSNQRVMVGNNHGNGKIEKSGQDGKPVKPGRQSAGAKIMKRKGEDLKQGPRQRLKFSLGTHLAEDVEKSTEDQLKAPERYKR